MLPQCTCPICGTQFTRHRSGGKPQRFCSRVCRQKRIPKPRQTLAERFWKHVDRSGGPDACWPWTGATTPGGYGVFGMGGAGGKQTTAHRVALELSEGCPLAADERACHTCDFPPCCNPQHLFRGTQAENLADASRKGRLVGNHGMFQGERNHSAKLTEQDVREIRRRAAMGERQDDIAADFGITDGMVPQIHTRHAWRHVRD
jgi:hypothetical protein